MHEKEKTVAVNPSAPTAGEQPSETLTTNSIPQTNAKSNTKISKTLTTVDGNTLMSLEFEPLRFAVDKILPHGLFIMAGSGKIGKSWLSLDICQAVASGGKLWDYTAEQGEALYLALEDNYQRLQSRLKIMEAESTDISRLHLATSSLGISDGLLEQIYNFLNVHSETKLIVIDTLEHIRNGEYDKNMYSCDYRDMNKLREITSRHKLSLLLIHHTRKMFDPDPLNTLSGSTGLVGAVDGVFVLEKMTRTGNKGKLTIANRDTENFCFKVEFDPDKCRWQFLENFSDGDESEDNLAVIVDDFLQENWSGTATDLCRELAKRSTDFEYNPATITKRLKSLTGLFRKEYKISVDFERKHNGKQIIMARLTE